MRYALYKSGELQRYQEFDTQPVPLAPEKQMEWVAAPVPPPVPPTLDELKTAKRAEINAKRAELETSGFSYLGKKFDSDQRSADRMQVAAIAAQSALMAGQPFQLDWTAMDNTFVPLDAAGVLGLIGAFASYGLSLHEQAKALKAQVDAATTVAEVEAVTWGV